MQLTQIDIKAIKTNYDYYLINKEKVAVITFVNNQIIIKRLKDNKVFKNKTLEQINILLNKLKIKTINITVRSVKENERTNKKQCITKKI